MGLLRRVRLSAVRGRSPGHHRHGVDDVPGRAGNIVGPGYRGVHSGAGSADLRLPVRGEPDLSAGLRRDLPDHHAALAARNPADDHRPLASATKAPTGGPQEPAIPSGENTVQNAEITTNCEQRNDDGAAGSRPAEQAFRRRQSGRRLHLLGRGRNDHCSDRAERFRQDDGLQHHHRISEVRLRAPSASTATG